MTNKTKNVIDYHYTECGLDNVLIKGMPVMIDDDGDEIIDITGINILHALIVLDLALKDGAWTASELKFVRSELGLTQSQLGQLVDKDRQSIARWEKSTHDIDKTAEIIIRMAAMDHLVELEVIKEESEIHERPPVKDMSAKVRPSAANNQIVIHSTGEGYRREAA